ncbi:tensin 3-2 isoform X1 [Echeneis naucrates]|uniref:tensin 3-2 isoform X1 n=3 Tax=Echeneis naucrates TaxID=173247 RepID=UPI00111387F0|nr:tensin-3-like isoform X1 [Echeneis naucrates]
MKQVMDKTPQIDLTFITERIISIFCPHECPEETYLQNLQKVIPMLQSKHGNNYLLINLSQKNAVLTQMNNEVLDTGWMDPLAPNLDQIYSMCATIDNWLQTNEKHVLVLHCRGGKGQLGVLVASYIHFSNMLASAGLSLDHFSMKRFYNDKLSALMTPSQKRYVWMLGSMLRGGLRMYPSPTFLLCVVLHRLPKIRPDGGCSLFLRVYQSLQAVCTSPVYHITAEQPDLLYFVLQPAQLLKGDIMVVCYDINSNSSSRQVVFRLQFHTGLVHRRTLTFLKPDLDCAIEDPRFPENGKVELLFSESPEKCTDRELWHNGESVTVSYDTLDPLVRRDSFQECPLEMVASHVLDPVNGSLYSRVRKASCEEGVSMPLTTSSPSCSDQDLSASSNSGLSVASQGQTGAWHRRGNTQDKCTQARKLFPGLDFEIAKPLLEVMTELAAYGGREVEMSEDEIGLDHTMNGEGSSNERETDILDDEDEVDDMAASALDIPSSISIDSLSSENLPETQKSTQAEYSTHSWVRQQQMLEAITENYIEVDAEGRLIKVGKERPSSMEAPDTPKRGISSREAVQRRILDEHGSHQNTDNAHNPQLVQTNSSSQEEGLVSLTTDIDESLEQLNQLILDLDPTFVPVPTRLTPLPRCASSHTNGLSYKGNAHLTGWNHQKQVSDVKDYAGPHSPGQRGPQNFSPPFSLSGHGHLHKANSVGCQGQMESSDIVPQTPAFPLSPPTPYVKNFSEFSQFRTGRQWDQQSCTQDAHSFVDGMNHSGSSTDGELFRSDIVVTPASCQRIFGSMCSVSSGSPLPHTDSSATPPPVWHDMTPNSLNSPYPPQPSAPLSLSIPNAHSSPRGALKSLGGGPGVCRETDISDLSLLLSGAGGLDHSLLEAVEGLGTLNLRGNGGLAPQLPEKKRWGEGGELGSQSPSLSGFSSPHSGSSLSIPFSSPMTPDHLRGQSGAPSPGADFGSKQDTVKFVQDTSKFWYKPDISRDQAIAVLKDREPGSFIVRDSHSFRGAYGLAMKVATPPPSVLQQSKKVGDLSNELVRHFLIECTQKGVRLKGCPNEPYFGSLTALVCQHSITPLALPCKLILPDKDPAEELNDSSAQTATNSAAELLKQGAACNVWYLGSVELESLTGHQAVQKATTVTLSMDPLPASTVVHFKVSAQGITLTDNQRKLFFRRHYAVNTVIFCSLDPQGRKWTRGSGSTAKIFGFIARKSQSETENMCHLFAEHDPEQPASAIVNFVSKVMIGSHKK